MPKILGLSLYAIGLTVIGAVVGHVLHGPDWARGAVVFGAFVSCAGAAVYGYHGRRVQT